MLRYLSTEYDKETTFSRKRLWKLLGMINEKYGTIDTEKLLNLNNVITTFEIDNFYFRANHKLDRILKTALDNLSDRRLIDATPRTVICKVVGNFEEHVVASDEEIATILSVERCILDELNCETVSQVVMRKRQKEFFKRVNDILYDEYKWKYFYKAYNIVFNHDDIKRFIPRLEMNLKDALHNLNSEIISALNSEAETLYNEKTEEYNKKIDSAEDEISFLEAVNSWHYPVNYVLAQKILANELISISTQEDIIPDNMIDVTLVDEEINKELDELFSVEDEI